MKGALFYGYARVSTEGQNDTSIEVQLEYLRLQAETLGMTFKSNHEKRSGKDVVGREVLTSLLDKLEEGDVIGVYDNSRLGRDTAENLNIIKTLYKKGVRVQVNGKIIDPNNPDDELFFSIQSSISTYQRKSQLLKSRAGINLKKKNGDWVMRGDLFGYKLTKNTRSVTATIIEEDAEIIRYIFQSYANGKSTNKITDELNNSKYVPKKGNMFYAASIRRIIHKPFYMGYYYSESGMMNKLHKYTESQLKEKLIKSNIYPPIVDPDLWWRVFNSYRGVKRTKTRQFEHRWCAYELSSIIRCGYCGAGFVHTNSKMKNESILFRYVCNVHSKDCHGGVYGVLARNVEPIMRATMYLTFIEPFELGSFFYDKKELLDDEMKENEIAIQRLEGKIKDLDNRKEKLFDAIEEGVIDLGSVKERIGVIEEDKKSLENKINNLSYSLVNREEELYDLLNEAKEEEIDKFKNGSPEVRRKKYIALIESAKLFKGKLIVKYKNGKTFEIGISVVKGRYQQVDYPIKVMFNNEFQYNCVLNTPTEELTYVEKESGGDEFIEYYNQFCKQQIESL